MSAGEQVIGAAADIPNGAELAPDETLGRRILENIKGGNLGSWPVVIGLGLIVLVFALTAQNFFTPANFNNIITQMAGTTLLAYGVVFVLLIGEIDLSIGYLSGICGVIVAELQAQGGAFYHQVPGLAAIILAIIAGACIGAFQGSFVAFIGVPAFVVTLAGLLAWQGVIQQVLGAAGPIIIQDSYINDTAQYFFSNLASWIIAGVIAGVYIVGSLGNLLGLRRAGITVRNPILFWGKLVAIPGLVFVVIAISNADRGLPLVGLIVVGLLIFLTYVTKRTTFGRHIYAVGGNAEAARRAGINVARIRLMVFMISGAMAGFGGVILAARLSSAAPDQGGGTLLLDAISSAVIGGASLFGGRGEIRAALLGSLVIATIANGLFIFNLSAGIIFITTGAILLFAVTLDTVARRRQAKTGR